MSNSIRRWIPFSSTGTSMPLFSALMLKTVRENGSDGWVELWRFWLFNSVNLVGFRLACVCDMTRSATGMACIVPVFAWWVACFSATEAFRSAAILILVKWLFAAALAWRPACSARTLRRTAIWIDLVYRSGALRECNDIFLGGLGTVRLFESFVKIVFLG